LVHAAYEGQDWTSESPLSGRPAAALAAPRRIVLHDYAGHAFQVQLSRELARRGHQILHLYAAANPTPKGALHCRADDPAGLAIAGLSLGSPYRRYAFVRRWRHEVAYGHLLADRVQRQRPDLVICCNTPLDSLNILAARCRRLDIPLVFWVQDLNGLAATRLLSRKLPGVGWLIGQYYQAMERAIARHCAALVLISQDFAGPVGAWGVSPERVSVIENWAPLDEVAPCPRDNPWSREQGLSGQITFAYTGMMGLKHNAGIILQLADHFRDRPEVSFVIVSEGLGAQWLARMSVQAGLRNLRVLGFQPYERLPQVLASADILLATLEADAGACAVPSKVLSYLCAGRPVLAAIPAANLAARLLTDKGAGLVTDPADSAAFIAAAERLVAAPDLRRRMARNARAYAQKAFDITAIANRFESVVDAASPVAGMARAQPRLVRETFYG